MPSPPSSVLPASAIRQGQLAVWKDERGFGFIHPDDGGPDVFLHISALRERPRRPQVGDVVRYRMNTGPDGKVRAEDATLVIALPSPTPSRPVAPASLPIRLMVFALTLLVLLASWWLWRVLQNPVPLALYPIFSLVTFGMYARDKACAANGEWRISESTLHLLEFLGGWPGGGVAQQLLRHKNRKAEYQMVFWTIVAVHLLGWIGAIAWFYSQHAR